ncbi:MAG: peptidoglycan recognition protein family protein [Anaerolineae bacterium]|nr:peptidoglycan recognition protein family protein [Anaerolineae bacterium]
MRPVRPPHRHPSRLSRRQVLTGLFAAGVGAGACSLLGAGGLLLVGLDRLRHPPAQPTATITPLPPPTLTPAPPPLISREAWGGLPPDHNAANEPGFYGPDNPEGWREYATPVTATYQTIVLHHSVIYRGNDYATMQEIQRAHRQTRGWADVGYHFMVGKSGDLFAGRPMTVRGTHVEGYNTGSLGVCLLGNLNQETVTDAQWNAVQVLLNWLVPYLGVSCLATHRDFNPQTECPGANAIALAAALARAFGLTPGTGCYLPPATATAAPALCTCGGHPV